MIVTGILTLSVSAQFTAAQEELFVPDQESAISEEETYPVESLGEYEIEIQADEAEEYETASDTDIAADALIVDAGEDTDVTAEEFEEAGEDFIDFAVPGESADISTATVQLSAEKFTYNGSQCVPDVTVIYNETTLVKDTDYTVAFENNINVGTATVAVKGTGKYTGSVNKTFTIDPAAIDTAVVTDIVNKTWDGNAQTQNPKVTVGNAALVSGTDYTLSYSNNINAGNASVIITGSGNYTGSLTKTFVISPVSLEGAAVSGITAKQYTGEGVAQTPVVVLNGRTLVNGTDYVLTYQNNVKVGKKASVTITGTGNCTGSITKTFAINQTSMKKAKVTNIQKKTYTGKRIKQDPTVTIDGFVLKKGRDYKITYQNNVNIGKAVMTIKGKGGYKGSIKKKFRIRKASIADATITNVVDKTFTGGKVTQSPKVVIGSRTLRSGSDYTLRYKNNGRVGTATVTVVGIRNYKGSKSLNFKIEKADIKNATVSEVSDKAYTGQPVTQKPVVKYSGKTLRQGRDYTLSYKNNVRIGTAEMIITGTGNYAGEKKISFQIKILPLEKAVVTGIEDLVYTGGPLVQSTSRLTVKLGKDTLVNGRDYRVSYSNNYNVGTAQLTVIGLGSYSGSITKSFSIIPKGTAMQSAQISNKRLFMKWTAQTQSSDGYQLQYSTDSRFENGSAIKSAKIVGASTDHTSYPLANDTVTYYVRIRTYKNVNGKAYFSKWSNVVASRRQ